MGERTKKNPKVTPVRAIKAKCKDCLAGYADGREDCLVLHCPLYTYMPYRKGTPNLDWVPKGRKMTEEQKAALAKRFAKTKGEDQ